MIVGLCASALFTPPSRAQSDLRTIDRQIDAQFTRRYQNARTLKHSLRAENIRDEEVKEIQMVVATLDRGFITSIGGVVAGCHCEEGPACTAFAPARERGKLRQAYAEELATLLVEMPQCAANPPPGPPTPKDSHP